MSLAADLAKSLGEQARLAILRLLYAQEGGTANDAVLCEAINALDFPCSREAIREHLFWLAGQGAISALDLRLKSGLVVATLTERGADIARGRAALAGVAAQLPER